MPKRDPNITARNDKALSVACDYCEAKVGEPCWTLRSNKRDEPMELSRMPHRTRIKAAWEKQFKERKRVA